MAGCSPVIAWACVAVVEDTVVLLPAASVLPFVPRSEAWQDRLALLFGCALNVCSWVPLVRGRRSERNVCLCGCAS